MGVIIILCLLMCLFSTKIIMKVCRIESVGRHRLAGGGDNYDQHMFYENIFSIKLASL